MLADRGGQRRRGRVEVTFTTADLSEQAAVSRACGMDRGRQLTGTTVRYSFAPERQATVFACLDHEATVARVGILG